jgi:predicted amidohydrolase YtcJ
MKKINSLLIAIYLIALASCNQSVKKTTPMDASDAIYYGGDIITMEGDSAKYAEAIAVKDGKIVFVGSKSDVEKFHGDSTLMNDLQGKTLLPGFIDPHSHFINALSITSQANCSPSPVGEANDIDGIIASLRKLKLDKKIPDGELIMGYGYDENAMPNGRLLNRDDLDKALPNNPVMVLHFSLHGAVLNSKAMEKFGVSNKTVTPAGGIIIRKPGTNEPYGLIMETAFLPIFGQLPKPDLEQQKQQLHDGQLLYASAGVTTAQEGASHLGDIDILETGAKNNALFIDVISYPFITEFDAVMKSHTTADFGKYNNHFKLGGIKITTDGSGPGKTALFTTPYLTGGPSGQKDWKGEPTFPQAQLNQMVKSVYDKNLPLLIHVNADGAIDMALKAHEYASAGNPGKERRTVMIHSQFIRKDQLKKYAEYNLIPSFFTEHTFFFADVYIKSRGLEQTQFISPMKTAISMGMHPTNHTDFNVFPIDQMYVLWTAVNRVSRTGQVIGADERITPYQALQAITTNAAYQYFEENSKGSLQAGKLADLVILDKNPLKVEPIKIKDIKVMETIKDGKSIYKIIH